jgi:S1-C subfamily serine protease
VFASVYWVKCYDSKGEVFATGSGFQVREGLVATNHHVIEGADRVTVSRLGSNLSNEARFVQHIDVENDLVILNVPESIAPALRIQPSGEMAIGTDVFAIGNPLGLEGTISQGIISGFRDTGSINLVQTTAPISPGNSGGPLVDSSGQVRGVVVASLKKGQNLNFAVPSETLTELLKTAPRRIRIQEVPRKRNDNNKSEQSDR